MKKLKIEMTFVRCTTVHDLIEFNHKINSILKCLTLIPTPNQNISPIAPLT